MPSTNGASEDWPYRFEVVPVNRLMVDPDYQRPEKKIARDIEDDFNPQLIGTLIASERPKKQMALIDGQQRFLGVTRGRHAIVLPAMVYEGLKPSDEASIFALLQRKRVNISTYERFRAQLMGREKESVAIQKIVVGAGFELGTVLTARTVKAVAALEWVYRREDGPELLKETMEILHAAWPGEDEGYDNGSLIKGIAMFLQRNDNVDLERLVRKLSAITPKKILMRADSLREGRGGSSNAVGYTADAIFAVYTRG